MLLACGLSGLTVPALSRTELDRPAGKNGCVGLANQGRGRARLFAARRRVVLAYVVIVV